jgi:hypothetical protein
VAAIEDTRAALDTEGGSRSSMTPHDHDSLRARLDAAIGWVNRHRHAFDPFHGDRAYRATLGQRSSELGVALYVHANRFPSERHRLDPLVDYLDDVRQRPELTHRVVRNPGEFVLNADLYGLLRLLGREDAAHRALLQRAVDAGFLDHVERHPHRELDVRLALEWAGLDHPWPPIQEIVLRSPLIRSWPSPLLLDEAAVYALTHLVLFATDFGIAGERHVDAESLSPLAAVVPALAVAACADHHWDLAGELLICHDALDLPQDDLAHDVWEAFLGQQLPDGAFPGPEAALRKNAPDEREPTPEELEEAQIAHCYHTTLIGWIAIANRIARQQSPTRRERERPPLTLLPRHAAASRSVAALHDRLIDVGARSHAWLRGTLAELEASNPTVGEACFIVLGLEFSERLAGGEGAAHAAPAASLPLHTANALRQASTIIDLASASTAGGADASATIRLLAGAVLLTRGIDLPQYLHLLPQVAAVLGHEDEASAGQRSDPALRQARSLLARLGLCHLPADLDEDRDLADTLRLPLVTRDRDGLLHLIGHLETACGWGGTVLHQTEWLDRHASTLEALAIAALRHADMELGCRLIRVLMLLGRKVDRAGWADYLLFHNRPDGAFGFFGPETRGLKSTGDDAKAEVRRLEIATTIACLWTLADLTQPSSFPACLATAGAADAASLR